MFTVASKQSVMATMIRGLERCLKPCNDGLGQAAKLTQYCMMLYVLCQNGAFQNIKSVFTAVLGIIIDPSLAVTVGNQL